LIGGVLRSADDGVPDAAALAGDVVMTKASQSSTDNMSAATNTTPTEDATTTSDPTTIRRGNDNYPVAIRNQQGIYRVTNDMRQGFENTVLVTASNYQFERFLSNWEIISAERGLKWALLSIDNETYVSRGGSATSVLLSSKHRPTGKVGIYQIHPTTSWFATRFV
jgi:hypothetical protein